MSELNLIIPRIKNAFPNSFDLIENPTISDYHTAYSKFYKPLKSISKSIRSRFQNSPFCLSHYNTESEIRPCVFYNSDCNEFTLYHEVAHAASTSHAIINSFGGGYGTIRIEEILMWSILYKKNTNPDDYNNVEAGTRTFVLSLLSECVSDLFSIYASPDGMDYWKNLRTARHSSYDHTHNTFKIVSLSMLDRSEEEGLDTLLHLSVIDLINSLSDNPNPLKEAIILADDDGYISNAEEILAIL